jgi:hypothetical protein
MARTDTEEPDDDVVRSRERQSVAAALDLLDADSVNFMFQLAPRNKGPRCRSYSL